MKYKSFNIYNKIFKTNIFLVDVNKDLKKKLIKNLKKIGDSDDEKGKKKI